MRALFSAVIVLTFAGNIWAQPSISGTSGALTQGGTLTITGTGFGTRPDYGGSQVFLNRGFNDFTVSLTAGGFVRDPDGQQPVAANLAQATSGAMGGALTTYAKKQNINRDEDEQLGSVTTITDQNEPCFFSSFWQWQSAGMPAAGAAGSKTSRWYYNDSSYSVYMGPGLENATNLVTPPAAINRWSGVSAFGGTSSYLSAIEDTWVGYEVFGCYSGGTTIFGSADYMEVFATIPGFSGTDRQSLMKRGTGLPSNPVPAQGTDANENQAWLEATTTQDNHTQPDLGSLLAYGEDPGVYYGFHDGYHDYSFARIYLHDAATLATSSMWFMQPPLTWSDTTITAQLNRGAFASFTGLYVTVCDTTNTCAVRQLGASSTNDGPIRVRVRPPDVAMALGVLLSVARLVFA